MKRGRKSHNGTDQEKKQVQHRMLISTHDKIVNNKYYDSKNMSEFMTKAVDEKIEKEESK